MEKYRLLISPWKNEFIDIIKQTKKELFVSSPFVNLNGVNLLANSISAKKSVAISLVTNLSVLNITKKITEPIALLELYNHFKDVKISSLGRLHAKIYISDNERGIITSANLTQGGLISNFEYGVLIEDEEIVQDMKRDILKYHSLGNIFSKNILKEIAEESNRFYRAENKIEKSIKDTKLSKLLSKTKENIKVELLKNRVKGGRTINSIFSDTILYLLKKKGALSTKELNPLIQAMHPDICDDSIDRIIEGQHFGKKWKHLVRDAQQSIKKRGLIYLMDGKWYLTN